MLKSGDAAISIEYQGSNTVLFLIRDYENGTDLTFELDNAEFGKLLRGSHFIGGDEVTTCLHEETLENNR